MPAPLARLIVWLNGAVVSPFADFFMRYRWYAALILALIATYRISDVVMGVMAFPFYKDMGFTKDEVAAVTKVYGVVMTLAGAFHRRRARGALRCVARVVRRRIAVGRDQSAVCLDGDTRSCRARCGAADARGVRRTTCRAASRRARSLPTCRGSTHVAYSATQYALFSSTMQLLPKFTGTFSGLAVDTIGYPMFFVGTALLGVPVLVLVALATCVRAIAFRRLPARRPSSRPRLSSGCRWRRYTRMGTSYRGLNL